MPSCRLVDGVHSALRAGLFGSVVLLSPAAPRTPLTRPSSKASWSRRTARAAMRSARRPTARTRERRFRFLSSRYPIRPCRVARRRDRIRASGRAGFRVQPPTTSRRSSNICRASRLNRPVLFPTRRGLTACLLGIGSHGLAILACQLTVCFGHSCLTGTTESAGERAGAEARHEK